MRSICQTLTRLLSPLYPGCVVYEGEQGFVAEVKGSEDTRLGDNFFAARACVELLLRQAGMPVLTKAEAKREKWNATGWER